ncbi:MAG: histidine kinase, partial [Clostridia bacterium]|nr:histidine kinase [Clostridia bacterium]
DLYNKDEVKYITEITRNLFVENKELNTSVYERANEIRRNQIKMLQAQICPHFVCNTLDAMNWLTYGYVKELNNPLSQTIQNMSLILENNLDLSTMFTTVGEEIKITERYADIINVRYQDAIDIKWDIDEAVLDCVIMKLCIQPLIENAASHGLVGIDRRGEITISVKEKGEDIEITVSDNGIGMEKEYLDELLESINDFEKINSSKNIGLRNINHRLRLLYGEDYKLSIESYKDKGTVCSFRILKSVLEIE